MTTAPKHLHIILLSLPFALVNHSFVTFRLIKLLVTILTESLEQGVQKYLRELNALLKFLLKILLSSKFHGNKCKRVRGCVVL